nr:MAG TPA: hypothetical protein [Caudoviricetes sp.]
MKWIKVHLQRKKLLQYLADHDIMSLLRMNSRGRRRQGCHIR